MATSSKDSTVKIWDASRKVEFSSHNIGNNPSSMEWDNTGNEVAVLTDDKKMLLIDPRANAIRETEGHGKP